MSVITENGYMKGTLKDILFETFNEMRKFYVDFSTASYSDFEDYCLFQFNQIIELNKVKISESGIDGKTKYFDMDAVLSIMIASYAAGYRDAKCQIREIIESTKPGERVAACEKALGDG